jgi:hypothetical protein
MNKGLSKLIGAQPSTSNIDSCSWDKYYDLSMEFLDRNEHIVLVPKDKEAAERLDIHPGSAICASIKTSPEGEKTFTIDYEGNLYNAVNLKSFLEKLRSACDRQERAYPTVARIWLSESDVKKSFTIIGIVDSQRLRDMLRLKENPTIEEVFNIYPESKNALESWVA